MTDRRIAFEEKVAAQASLEPMSLSLQERLALSLGRLKSERGSTNKDLAEKLGVSEAYMSQVTRGMRDVKLTTLDKMIREWNVSLEDLFKVTEDDLARVAAAYIRRRKRKSFKTETP